MTTRPLALLAVLSALLALSGLAAPARGGAATWVEASLLEVAAGPGPGLDHSHAPRRFDRDPEATAQREEAGRAGQRQHEFLDRERAEARRRIDDWKRTHAADARQLELRQEKMERFRSQIRAKAKAQSDPWWLKDLPWWMPSPPEWGPMPSTMYTAYFHPGKTAPLADHNYFPLTRRVDNLEPPLGANNPLESVTASGKALGPADLMETGKHRPVTTPVGASDSPAGKAIAEGAAAPPPGAAPPAPPATALLETGAAAAYFAPLSEHPQYGNADFWKPHMMPTTGAEILPDYAARRVPEEVRYDTSLAPGRRPYADYWRRWHAAGRPGYRPYRFEGVPDYPTPSYIRARTVAALGGSHASTPLPGDRLDATTFAEPTEFQVAQLQEIGMREDRGMPAPYADLPVPPPQ